jgi:hypothetical protein
MAYAAPILLLSAKFNANNQTTNQTTKQPTKQQTTHDKHVPSALSRADP